MKFGIRWQKNKKKTRKRKKYDRRSGEGKVKKKKAYTEEGWSGRTRWR